MEDNKNINAEVEEVVETNTDTTSTTDTKADEELIALLD